MRFFFTLKASVQRADLDEFVKCYDIEIMIIVRPRSEKKLDRCWRSCAYDALESRDKARLDFFFWLKEESLEASGMATFLSPMVIAQEIVEDLEAALKQFRDICGGFGRRGNDIKCSLGQIIRR